VCSSLCRRFNRRSLQFGRHDTPPVRRASAPSWRAEALGGHPSRMVCSLTGKSISPVFRTEQSHLTYKEVYGRNLTWPSEKGAFSSQSRNNLPVSNQRLHTCALRPMLSLAHGSTNCTQSAVMCPIIYRPQRRLDQQHPPFFPAPVRRGDQRG
jgi:hypothetical protein